MASRYRCDQGRGAEARHVVARLYASFTDGDTRDLIEAKALLDELA